MTSSILLVQLLCTGMMTGVIWFVQVVHYPLFASVGASGFTAYEAQHATRTGWVVGPLMVGELVTATLMVLPRYRVDAISRSEAVLGLALVIVIWASTALLQVPLHNRLAAGYDTTAVAQLVRTNWIRTAAWSLRSLLILRWLFTVLR